MSQSSIFLERYEYHTGLVYLYCRIAIRWGLRQGLGFFFLFFQRQYTYYEVQYVVVGEEQRPDRWCIMPRRICTELYVRWELQAYKGTVLVHICPEDGISTFFFLFFHCCFCCRAPPITQAHRTCAPSFITAQ